MLKQVFMKSQHSSFAPCRAAPSLSGWSFKGGHYFSAQVQRLAAMNEALQKDLKSLSTEEAQMKRALAMKLDKESKQQIRRQKKKEVKDQQVKNIYG